MVLTQFNTKIQKLESENVTKFVNHELTVLEGNDTWDLVALLPNKKAIGSNYVFKLKLNLDDNVQWHKVRLVSKGYNQVDGVDYFNNFSPVAKVIIIKFLLGVAVSKGWPFMQLYVNNTFLYGHLDKEIYMIPPKGYTKVFPGRRYAD
ncbi:UNVERIFIED_CONTAM: hypothetical protein Sangu_2919700 [Sesamum angustifolium]|uniref:Reverse transcriptase Ty1/copia-type domain-containing protein n=1 Tax=Sesamum angustifolium TaxID=2727405 RepID=A0AAW2IL96_9LAMI